MSTKLGTLTLDLIAKIGSFTGPIRDAERQTESSFANMRKHVNSYGAIAISGAAAVGAGVFAMANEYANAAREIQTFASISNANTQEFQKMAVGAETVGIPMDKLSDQLKDFNEKLGEFTTIGSGGAVDFFEQIAIKTEGSAEGARKLALEMQNLSGPKALQLYVDKLEEAGVTQEQMSFYLESMASDTTNLIPLLKDGGKGFEFWADAAERAGLMSEETIAKAGELTVQMKLLDLQVKGAKNQFIQGLMPALVSVGDGMSNATTETNLMADAGETLGEVFKGVAAVGMGVYAVVEMLSNSIAGLAFTAVEAKNNVDKAADKGSWADRLPGVKLAKTLITSSILAKAPNSGVSMAAQDNAKVVDDVANSINRIYNNTVNQSAAAMAKIQSSQAGVTKGSDEWIKKQNEAAKAATSSSKANSEAAKALREYNQALELGKRLIYEYGDEQLRISEDLKKDLEEIQSASLKPEAKERYSTVAKMQADARKKLYIAELDLELNEHKFTEEDKLEAEININKLRLDAQRGLNENELKLRKQALGEKYNQETEWLRLEQAQRLNNSQEMFLTDIQNLTSRYEFEREQIRLTKNITQDEKDALTSASYKSQDIENDRGRTGAWSDYQNAIGIDTSAEDAQSQRDESIQAAFEWQLITQEEYQDKLLESQAKYQNAKALLGVSEAESTLNGMTELMGSLLGEQSAGYKAMFMMQKAAALAKVILNAPETFSNVYNAVSSIPYVGPYLAPVMAGGALAVQLGQAAQIKSTSLDGMAHDGIDNIPNEGTWLLDKGERVVDSRTNSDLKNYLAGNKQGVQITINNNTSANVSARQNADGTVTVDVVDQMIQQSWDGLSKANSKQSRAIQSAFGLAPSR